MHGGNGKSCGRLERGICPAVRYWEIAASPEANCRDESEMATQSISIWPLWLTHLPARVIPSLAFVLSVPIMGLAPDAFFRVIFCPAAAVMGNENPFFSLVQAAEPGQDGQHGRRAAAVQCAIERHVPRLHIPAAAAHHADQRPSRPSAQEASRSPLKSAMLFPTFD